MEPRIGFSREMARKLLRNYGVKNPPVPVEAIITQQGFKLHWADYRDNTSGESWWEEGVGHIEVNRHHHPHRQRFTMAHELGHLVMRHAEYRLQMGYPTSVELPRQIDDDGGEERQEGAGLQSDLQSKDPVEVEANQFAAELLMPLRLFKKEWRGVTDVPTMAARYQVSEAAAWWRVRSFALR